jgi:DNA-binding GntR family transcriptional regulator
MSQEAAITRGVLSHAVKDRLLQRIVAGTYPPGSRIVETRVARELGTSQAPVREALRDLEALGVVEISPFRGARVRRPGLEELLEAYGVRAELEAMAVRLAMPRVVPDDLDAMAALLDDMRRCADAGDTLGEAAADTAFHARLVDRAGNLTLRRVWGQLEPFSRTYITIAVPGGDPREMAELHAPILDVLRSRDAAAAEHVIRDHFTTARASLAERWALAEPGGAAPESPGAIAATVRS